MDGNNWNDSNQSFPGGQQQYNNGNQQSQHGGEQQYQPAGQQFQGAQQPQFGGQQQYQPVGQQSQGIQQPQLGQQQYGGQHIQTASQQQQYGMQQFPAYRSQQAQGGQFGVGGHFSQGTRIFSQNQVQYSNRNVQALGDLWAYVNAPHPSASGDNGWSISAGVGQAAASSSSRGNVSAPIFPPNVLQGLAATLQRARNHRRQQLMQAPTATRDPSGPQSSNGHTSGQASGNSFNQQISPRRRPLGSQPQPMNGQQQYMGNSQQSQQIPMAMRVQQGQSSNNSSGQQVLPHQRLQGTPSQHIGNQQQRLGTGQQVSSSASRLPAHAQQQYQGGQPHFMAGQRQSSQNSQQFSPTAAQFQPGVQQHFSAGSFNMSSQQAQGTRQISTSSRQFSPSASQFQPGAQQHFANNQPIQPGSQHQMRQQYSQEQLGLGAQNFDPSARQFQQPLGGYHSHDGQSNAVTQHFETPQQPIADARQFLDSLFEEDDDFMDEDTGLYNNEVGKEDESDENAPQRMLDRTEQWQGQMAKSEGQDGNIQVPEGLMDDPLYQQTLQTVKEWATEFNVPMTEDGQVRFAVDETLKMKATESAKGGKRPAELDEDDIDEDVIEELVRDAKRQRIRLERSDFYANTQKVYVQGPENRPEPMDMDNNSADDNQVSSYDLDLEILGLKPEFKGQFSGETLSLADNPFKRPYEHQVFDRNFRLIESICCDWTFMIEVTKHLRVKDIIMLYSISKTFHNLVNLRFQSTIAAWAQEISPSGWKVFYWKIYGDLTRRDPAGKPWAMPGPVDIPRPPWAPPRRIVSSAHQVRSVPSLKYLAMIAQRERRVRDILACLARAGHRLPETTHVTMKKMWMLMDISTNRLRRAFIRNEGIWTSRDLYNAQMFSVKLQMRFNEPIFGPNSTVLADTFLGLRDGLNPLWRLLRRKDYLNPEQVVQQRLKYYCPESTVQHFLLIGNDHIGVPPALLGHQHKEGWGNGKMHLSRPDELVVEESVRRNLRMDKHLEFMVFWGHVDWKKRLNLVPTEEEMYMSDDELPPLPKTGKYAAHSMWGKCGNVPFEFDNWQPKHSMKARWKTLTREEKLAIIKDDREEQMRALPFEKDVSEKFWDLPYNSNDRAHPDYPDGEPPKQEMPECSVSDGDTEMGEADDEESGSEIGSESGSEESFFAPVLEWDPDLERREQEEPKKAKDEEEAGVILEYEYTYEDDALPMPDTVEDEDIIAHWDELDPYLQQSIIDEQEKFQKQDAKDERTLAIIVHDDRLRLATKAEKERTSQAQYASAGPSTAAVPSASTRPSVVAGPSTTLRPSTAAGRSNQSSGHPSPYTSPMKKQPKRYKYPGIKDAISLALLEKYDRFAPEEFRTDEGGNILRGDHQPSSASISNPIELSDYDDYDDEELKALADEDSDQVEFDLDSYEHFLTRIGDRGGFREPDSEEEPKDEGKGKAKEKAKAKAKAKSKKDIKGKGKAIAVENSDDEYEYDRDEMAHEGDLDDDIPLPKYDFRKF